MTVSVVRDTEALQPVVEAWRLLARSALESNVFYEPEMLLPALRHLRDVGGWQVVLVYRGGELAGLFPLQRARAGCGTGLVLEPLRHAHSFLHTPLLHRDHAEAAVAAWLEWCARASGAAVILCHRVTIEGPVARLLRGALDASCAGCVELRRYQRPLLEPHGDADAYLRKVLNSEHRRRLRRNRELLEAQGAVSVEQVGETASPEAWIDGFLELEASGWKGRERTALACRKDHERFFRAMVGDFHRQGRALLFGLSVDGRRVAMTCLFRAAGGGAFGFKPAYDEAFQKLSPGLLLEAELVRLFHGRLAGVGWIDSSSAPDGTLLRRLWSGRRTIGTLGMAVPGMKGRLALAAVRIAVHARSALRGAGAGSGDERASRQDGRAAPTPS